MTSDCLLTLAGLKLLQTEFAHNKKEWRLVAIKGKSYLKKKLGGINDNDLDQLINQVEVNLKK
jgi:hypothetical protein